MRLNDRAGEMRYIDPVTEQERSSRLWLRQIGGHNAWRDSNGQLRTTSHRYVSQLGAELLTGGFTDSDSWRLGVMAGYAATTTQLIPACRIIVRKGVSEAIAQGCMPLGLPMTSVKKAHTLTPGRNIAGLKTR